MSLVLLLFQRLQLRFRYLIIPTNKSSRFPFVDLFAPDDSWRTFWVMFNCSIHDSDDDLVGTLLPSVVYRYPNTSWPQLNSPKWTNIDDCVSDSGRQHWDEIKQLAVDLRGPMLRTWLVKTSGTVLVNKWVKSCIAMFLYVYCGDQEWRIQGNQGRALPALDAISYICMQFSTKICQLAWHFPLYLCFVPPPLGNPGSAIY